MRRLLSRALRARCAALAALVSLSACSNHIDAPADPASAAINVQAAWVEIGDANQAIARAITTYQPASSDDPLCPQLIVDGKLSRMTLRAGAATLPQRPTASDPADSKPSSFPVSVCEATLPANAQTASVAGRTLPLPKAQPQRIAIIADTGCRMKKADNAWQACNDPTVWPFDTIAASVAKLSPDLVLHVGDYHYRENACPPDIAGCKDSPWGYGWDTWQADLFRPAAPLMAKAPWVVVRGNHEECARAGQGWFRFLDPRPYSASRSCDDPANDNDANYSEPYAVSLGGGTQVIVFDSAKVGRNALKPTDAQFRIYQKQFQTVAALASKAGMTTTIFTNHHPILAFAPIAGSTPAPGNLALQSVMSSLNAQAYYPPGVHVALHGHVHDFQAINFSSGHPATIVSGNGGDNLDVALPDPFPAGLTPAPGAVIERLSHNNSFGFLIMERRAAPATGWVFHAYSAAGKLLASCDQSGTTLACDKTGFIAP
ncbi:metallophosphoesterase family protein [Burkholderia multivorans]|uniref:metallophosphoesterase family protein n=1 Tax=Burkholderia multivorans TaxID=87883 RepID=UPI0019D104AC|nr:metallophosphoesterase [Burkholderia multivorans]MBN6732250.1 metallophosphoesterase [Burkholderia multivorans]MBN6734508.1 metallophosphoesterase [Burkholderia multivorans]MBN7126465.1 serine/threonine protein phosphatase [Burkholderia multivorans]MBN8166066.1 serine/threonine protein phosphatase [Burkholderia multivorans]MBN8171855.1 serine/threonine protein phosphatase [Burkholderia multivorans]